MTEETAAPFAPGTSVQPPIDLLKNFNINRIPQGESLETLSSDVIGGLLNPPTMFADVDRQSAELGAARGVGGSASAFGVGLRLTDEERLKRMTLGENFLSQAFGRQPTVGTEDLVPWTITPSQQRQFDIQQGYLDIAKEEARRKERAASIPSVTYGGGGGGGGVSGPRIGGWGGGGTDDTMAFMAGPWGPYQPRPEDYGPTGFHGTGGGGTPYYESPARSADSSGYDPYNITPSGGGGGSPGAGGFYGDEYIDGLVDSLIYGGFGG